MWDEYISKLNFTALCIIKRRGSKLSNETIYGLIPYKEGYVNEAYTFFSRFWEFKWFLINSNYNFYISKSRVICQ